MHIDGVPSQSQKWYAAPAWGGGNGYGGEGTGLFDWLPRWHTSAKR